MVRIFLCYFMLSLFATGPLLAKSAVEVWGVWGGEGFGTIAFGTLRGVELKDRPLTLFAFHYGHPLVIRKRAQLLYTVDVLPAVFAKTTPAGQNGVHETVYGFGASPVGFQVNFGSNRVQPFAFISGGFLIFNRPTPTARATRWNFATDAGGGLQFPLRDRNSIAVGYRLHHISNAGIGSANPSLNTNVLYVGFNFLR